MSLKSYFMYNRIELTYKLHIMLSSFTKNTPHLKNNLIKDLKLFVSQNLLFSKRLPLRVMNFQIFKNVKSSFFNMQGFNITKINN